MPGEELLCAIAIRKRRVVVALLDLLRGREYLNRVRAGVVHDSAPLRPGIGGIVVVDVQQVVDGPVAEHDGPDVLTDPSRPEVPGAEPVEALEMESGSGPVFRVVVDEAPYLGGELRPQR